jgi:hypothetical protein
MQQQRSGAIERMLLIAHEDVLVLRPRKSASPGGAASERRQPA